MVGAIEVFSEIDPNAKDLLGESSGYFAINPNRKIIAGLIS